MDFRVFFRLLIVTTVVGVLAIASPALAQRRGEGSRIGPNCGGGFQTLFEEIEPVPPSAAEVDEVLFLREEEKLARDVYLTLAERWQLPIFANIARAEQKHMDAVLLVIEVYGLVDPVADDTVGVFSDDDLGALFNELIADGAISLVEALKVGATIEDMDLADLYHLIEFTDNDHIELVAFNLAKGSRNHLRAFMRALDAQGETYSPQYLDQATFDAILAADMERRTFFNADGEPVPSCGAEIGGFGMRRGSGHGGGSQNNNGGGTDSGNCDGTGPGTDNGRGDGGGP